jgi:hypothetical protein
MSFEGEFELHGVPPEKAWIVLSGPIAVRDALKRGGGTEVGGAFAALCRDHPHAVDRRTAVVVSDGLDVGDEDVLIVFIVTVSRWFARTGRRTTGTDLQ